MSNISQNNSVPDPKTDQTKRSGHLKHYESLIITAFEFLSMRPLNTTIVSTTNDHTVYKNYLKIKFSRFAESWDKEITLQTTS